MSNTIWILVNESDRDCDCCNEMVVVAATPERARYIAASHAVDEGKNVWLDPTRSSCEPVDASAEGLVVREAAKRSELRADLRNEQSNVKHADRNTALQRQWKEDAWKERDAARAEIERLKPLATFSPTPEEVASCTVLAEVAGKPAREAVLYLAAVVSTLRASEREVQRRRASEHDDLIDSTT